MDGRREQVWYDGRAMPRFPLHALVLLGLPALAVGCQGVLVAGGPADDDSEPPTGSDDDDDDDDTTTEEPPLEQVPEADPGPDPPPGLCRVEIACDSAIPDEPKVPCQLRVDDSQGETLYDGWAGVELRGRSSMGFPKHQYNLELWEAGRTLVAPGSSWRYLDDGAAPAADWIALDFDDDGWGAGTAPLGYGDTQVTWISYGYDPAHKHVTSWFRHGFQVGDTATAGPLTVGLRRDAGGVVYLNGEEVLRANMPEGPIEPTTLANDAVEGIYELKYFREEVDPALLLEGENVVAVELHRASPAGDDLTFDLWLGDVGGKVSVDLFDMGGESDWILGGNYPDRALFRNKLSFDLYQSFGDVECYAPEVVLCEASIDGEWQGVFTWGERIKRDDDRIPLQEDELDLGRSFIVKNDDGGGGIADSPSGYGEWFPVYPRAGDLTEQAREGVVETLALWEGAALGADPADPDSGIFAHMEIDSAVDWVLIQELSKNNDAYFLSIYLSKDVDGKLRFVPWDHDLAYGGYPVGNCPPSDWIAYRSPLIEGMAEVPEFRARLLERWAELRSSQLSEANILGLMDLYVETMGDAAYANFEVWPMDEIEFSWDGIDWLCPVASFDEEQVRFEEWILARLAWIDANIEGY